MPVVEVNHPLVRHKLGLMRKKAISTKDFRDLAAEVARMLTYEATRDMETEPHAIAGWAGPVTVERIREKKVTVLPILRAGLGMLDGVLDLLPNARVSVVGLYRNEETLEPVCYFRKLPGRMAERSAILIDPMLATGGSATSAVGLLKQAGCRRIKGLFLVAAPEGLARLEKAHPDVEIYVAAVDEGLDEHGYILPGLGDAGDKIFGTL